VSGCNGDATGSITVTATGGTGAYTYSLNGSAFSAGNGIFNNLKASTYNIIAKDANGCTATLSPVTLTEPALLTITLASATDISCNGANDGKIVVFCLRGVSRRICVFHKWRYFGTSPTFNNLPAGSYDITVKDANSCTVELQDVVLVAPVIMVATVSSGKPNFVQR
jgi:hypothetical protein